MSLNLLRLFARFALVVQHATGVYAAYGTLVMFNEGKPLLALLCLCLVAVTAAQVVPKVPGDD
jgi:hypothetical protein